MLLISYRQVTLTFLFHARVSYIYTVPAGFATLDKAAALGLATGRAVTDLRQYINSDLGYSDLKFLALYTN